MHRSSNDALRLSATDLANFSSCGHLTQLDRFVVAEKLQRPAYRDPLSDVLAERGMAHEEGYLEYLESCGRQVVRLSADTGESALDATIAAMRVGADAIAQPTLSSGRWQGRADVLLRVERPSDLGAWSYDVADTKLAAETRGGTVLQLCLYADLVATIQGVLPEHLFVVSPGHYAQPECLRTLDYHAYYRRVRSRLEAAVSQVLPDAPEGIAEYPEPVDACDVCRWWQRCDARRRGDDHLSLVAGAARSQRHQLESCGITTVVALAQAGEPVLPVGTRGSPESFARIREQARLQVASRASTKPLFEILPHDEPGTGLARLPDPCPGDVFLDFEGDPFVEGGGREYLTGWVTCDAAGAPEYHRLWALTAAEERAAFEAFVDQVTERWRRHPGLHIYHFHSYEPSAMKRMMGRHATREEEVDQLLRGERFVDLHAVVRQGLRVGIERYGLKQLEPLIGFERQQELRDASYHLRRVERALELSGDHPIPPESRAAVEAYNREDCLSTLALRDWLEDVRARELGRGRELPRPVPGDGEPPEDLDEKQKRLRALFEQLTTGISSEPAERSESEEARLLLGHLLEFHRREDKAVWWEYFRLAECTEAELRNEKRGLSGLRFLEEVPGGPRQRVPTHRYAFAIQDGDVREGDTLHRALDPIEIGVVVGIDWQARTLDIKKRGAAAGEHPRAVFAHDQVRPHPKPEAIEAVARFVAENGIEAPGPFVAGRDLLLRRHPRVAQGGSDAPLVEVGEERLDAARRLVLELEEGTLPVQGPPGSGKTYMGARMICALVAAGRKVGVTAVSHKVIRNLLDAVAKAASEDGLEVRCAQKVRDESDADGQGVLEVRGNDELFAFVSAPGGCVAGATSWAWARDDAEGLLDTLVVDEAGQMSLADVIAVSRSARSLILLGDPQQLEQPIQGSHPEGSGVSALEHLIAGHETLPEDRGLFLAQTWRLHPSICAFTSDQFYESKLTSREVCDGQEILGNSPFAGSGLWWAPTQHTGNTSTAEEEVVRVVAIAEHLASGALSWRDPHGVVNPLGWPDVLIVAPYNAQVIRLQERLPAGARVGTVDKFQGQEAPVSIYSLTTSSAAEAPRGMDFLFSRNRLNVATSRARCACIVVASPELLEAECRTPGQMRLANGVCGFVAMAREVSAP